MDAKREIVTRFPPSPTGFLHVGSVRTALYNYFFARKNSGKFILRIEDTDRERSKVEYEQDIIDGLKWLGLEHDNKEVVRQSKRGEVYKNYLKKLVDSGHAYISKEEVKEEGQRGEVIRFKNPNKVITFNDLIRGDVSFDTTELGDFVIAKSLTEPLYHLAVVIDDHEAGITHVIRGEDGISNTPRQILIQEGIGAARPTYAHLPLILSTDRAKLSKRKHGEKVSLRYYIEQGYLKEAIINYMALLGWNPGTEQEIFTLDGLIETFDIARVQKGGAIFNEEKLRWVNKEHLNRLSKEKFLELIKKDLPKEILENQTLLNKMIDLIRERTTILSDVATMKAAGEFNYYYQRPQIDTTKILWKDEKDPAKTKTHIERAIELLNTIPEPEFTKEKIKEVLWPYAEKVGKGNVLWPTRYALSGKDRSPDPFVLADTLGKAETLKRLEIAKNAL